MPDRDRPERRDRPGTDRRLGQGRHRSDARPLRDGCTANWKPSNDNETSDSVVDEAIQAIKAPFTANGTFFAV